jgi:site-specific recombinase XerD
MAADAAHRARSALALLAGFREHGVKLDEAARYLIDTYVGFEDFCRDIRAVGAANLTEQAMRVNCRRALSSALMNTDLQQEIIPPLQRHSFAELVEQWARGIEIWAAARLPIEQIGEAA